MKIIRNNLSVEIVNQLPYEGQLAYFNNKIWKVVEICGTEIIHLQRPRHQETVSLFREQIRQVQSVVSLAHV